MNKSTILHFLLLGGFIGFFVWLGNRDKPPTPPPVPVASATPTPAPPPPPAPARAPAAAPAPQRASEDEAEKIRQIAEQTRVEIRRFERRGGTGLVEVQWSSDVATQGATFCDGLRNAGIIRSYDLGDVPFTRGQSPDGRQLMIAQFKVTF